MKPSPFKPKSKPPLEPPPSESTKDSDMLLGTEKSLPWDKLSDPLKIERSREVIRQLLQMYDIMNNRVSLLEAQLRSHNHQAGQVVIPLRDQGLQSFNSAQGSLSSTGNWF